MAEFFKFENQRQPPSISNQGRLCSGTKSDILECMKVKKNHVAAARDATVVVIDGAVMVQMVRPTTAKTFHDYVNTNIAGFVRSHMSYKSVTRLDIVFDTYPEENLKAQTHQRRATGSRTKVNGRTPIPKCNWNSDFLKNEGNKEELFVYISEELTKHGMSGKLLLSTKKDAVLSNRPGYDMSALQPCNHPEADTRIFLHLAHAGANGH